MVRSGERIRSATHPACRVMFEVQRSPFRVASNLNNVEFTPASAARKLDGVEHGDRLYGAAGLRQ